MTGVNFRFTRVRVFSTLLLSVILSTFGFLWSNGSSTRTATQLETVTRSSAHNNQPCISYKPPDSEFMAENGLTLATPIPSSAIQDQDEDRVRGAAERGVNATRFTVLMLVYSRAATLHQLVMHYICMSAVDKMIVLWIRNYTPPAFNTSSTHKQRECLEKLVIKPVDNLGLAARFQNIYTDIHTEAVFSVDDDQLVDESDVKHAFDVWKKHPWGIVGFNKKRYTASSTNGQIVYGGEGPLDYHFLLTNSAFLHRSYIEIFDTRMPREIIQEIDRRRNCEDLAMNLLVSDFCRCTAAFYVAPNHPINGPGTEATSGNAETALSSRPKHYIERSECLNSFARFYNAQLPPNSCVY